jgi:hypothetical protein
LRSPHLADIALLGGGVAVTQSGGGDDAGAPEGDLPAVDPHHGGSNPNVPSEVTLDRADSVTQMVDESEAVVEGTVVDIQPGPTASPRPRTPGGPPVPREPTEEVTVEVKQELDGATPRQITVYRTVLPKGVWAETPALKPYEVGERYILFLGPGPGDTYIPVAADGRLIVEQGEAEALIEPQSPVGEELHGQTPAEVEEVVQDVQ